MIGWRSKIDRPGLGVWDNVVTVIGSVAVVIDDIESPMVVDPRDGDNCPARGLGGSAALLFTDPVFELDMLRFPLAAIAPL